MELKNFFAQDDQGNKLPGATCYLYQRGTESVVSGLLKANGAPLSNPFTAGNDGLIQLAAANGLYDVRVVAGGRDYRIPLQFGDVTQMVFAAETAARQSESARDTINLAVGRKPDIATGLLQTAEGGRFTVIASNSADYIIEYEKRAGAAVEIKRYPSAEGVRGSYEGVVSTVRHPGKRVAYSKPVTTRYGTVSGALAWGVGFFPETDLVSRVSAQLMLSSLAVKARVRVYRRSAPASFVAPGTAVVDSLEREVVVDLMPQGVALAGVGRSVTLEAVFEPLFVLKDYPLMLTIEAFDAQGAAAVCGIGTTPYVVGAPAINYGYVQYTVGGNWAQLGATQPWPAITVDNGEVAKTSTVAVGTTDLVYYETTLTDWNRADFSGWGVNFPTIVGATFDAVVGNLGLISQNATLQVKVYSRLVSAADDIAGPGAQASDCHLVTRLFQASDIASSDALTKVVFPVGPLVLATDRFPVVEVIALKADGTKGVLGAGKAGYATKPVQSTWMLAAAGTPGFVSLQQNNAVSLGLARTRQKAADLAVPAILADVVTIKATAAQQQTAIAAANTRIDDLTSQIGLPQLSVADLIVPKLSVVGRVVNLAGSYAVLDGTPVSFSGSFTLTKPATGSETKTGYTLKYAPGGATLTANTNAYLWRRRLSQVVVTRQSDGVVLTEGVDYSVDYSFGKLYGRINKADYLVDVAYTYQRERYDLLQVDLTRLEVSVVAGTERDMDAHEFGPVKGERKTALYLLYVHEDAVTAVPLYRFEKGVRRDSQAVFDRLQANNKVALAKTLAKLRKGFPIKMVGYGHSIVAHGGYDLLWYFEATDGTTRNAIPRYDRGDSAGAWAVKTSYLWVAKLALESAFGVTIDYLNAGKSGTSSSSAANQGLDPARLGPVLASGADLLILDFAMNEIGADTTYANFKSIIQQAKAAGMEVVVMACQQTNKLTDTRDIAGWRKTNRTLELVAADTGSAFCATHWLTDQGGGGMPVAPEQLCSANFFNHPGITENRVYGEMLGRMFL